MKALSIFVCCGTGALNANARWSLQSALLDLGVELCSNYESNTDPCFPIPRFKIHPLPVTKFTSHRINKPRAGSVPTKLCFEIDLSQFPNPAPCYIGKRETFQPQEHLPLEQMPENLQKIFMSRLDDITFLNSNEDEQIAYCETSVYKGDSSRVSPICLKPITDPLPEAKWNSDAKIEGKQAFYPQKNPVQN